MVVPKFKCSCPDFTGIATGDPAASSITQQINRDWSGAGTSMGGRGLRCKHIWAVIINLKLIDQVGIPSDPRSPPAEKNRPASTAPKMQKSQRLGDDFGFDGM